MQFVAHKRSAIIIFIIAILSIFAAKYYLYWVLPWFDVMMHFLGGAFVAYALVAVIPRRFYDADKNYFYFGRLLMAVLIVGISWELFEYIFNIQDTLSRQHIDDTGLDLLMDVLGAIGAGLSLKYLKKYE